MLKNKVILICGASRGIGAECARKLAQHQARLILNYHSSDKDMNATFNSIKKISKHEPLIFKADITNELKVLNMIKNIIKKCGKIDTIIINASPSLEQDDFGSLDHLSWDHFEKHLETAICGAFNIIKCCLPHLKAQRSGKIITMLSSVTISRPPTRPIPYIVSKYALLGLSKVLAMDLARYGITVNSISPGLIDEGLSHIFPEKVKELTKLQTPLGRLGHPSDVASIVAFLCSKESNYLTGVNIPVCGGYVVH